LKTENLNESTDSLSRRSFLTGAGTLAAGGVVASTLIPTLAYAEEAQSGKTEDTDESEETKIFDGVELSIGRVIHDQGICSGCRTCEIVCSVYHEGVASSSLSRIQWNKRVMDACITDIMICKHCSGAECVAVCPNGSLSVDPETGARVINEKECVGCQLCLNACPVSPSMIRYNAKKNVCFKCNLCEGDPQCVKHCPTGALAASWVEADDSSKEDELYEISLTGEAKTFAHLETATIVLSETGSAIVVDGVLWTSHATHSSIILAVFDVKADFYSTDGTLLGSSDNTVHIEIPEMSSGEFSLTWTTSKKISDLGKIAIEANGEVVRNY